MSKEKGKLEEIEASIRHEYRSKIWTPFIDALKTYRLIDEGDRIAVCISGGKDSMLLALLLRMLERVSDFPFNLEYIVMDPGYREETLTVVKNNLALFNLDAEICKTDIFSSLEDGGKYPCYRCAKMRRGWLYRLAKERGCNKIALGHHKNDVIETVLMGMFYSSMLQSMPPKLKSKNWEGMELIRPLYRINEDDILAWCDTNNLSFIRCACTVTEKNSIDGNGSKREEMKRLIKTLEKDNRNISSSIFNSVHNVYLSTFAAYRDKNELISFLEHYDDE